MHKINPRKLLNSKWTATRSEHKEKHFIVTELVFAEDGLTVTHCVLEAVYTRRAQTLPWQTLTDDERWRQGWH